MEKPQAFPEKFFSQLVQAHYDSERMYEAKYFILVDLTDNRPQTFDVFSYHAGTASGMLYNASPDPEELSPVAIVDRETALWLISQTAIANSEDTAKEVEPHELNKRQPVYQLLPVFGAMIPDCLPKNGNHE